jgi:hypothetical protein
MFNLRELLAEEIQKDKIGGTERKKKNIARRGFITKKDFYVISTVLKFWMGNS